MTTHMDAQNELDFRLARSQFLYEQAERKARVQARAQIWNKWTDVLSKIVVSTLVVVFGGAFLVGAVAYGPTILVVMFAISPALPFVAVFFGALMVKSLL